MNQIQIIKAHGEPILIEQEAYRKIDCPLALTVYAIYVQSGNESIEGLRQIALHKFNLDTKAFQIGLNELADVGIISIEPE